jgi:hypothetical protein
MEIDKICRLCLSSQTKDNAIALSKISHDQKSKFEEMTGAKV